ncbi:MAG: iron-sulfur cluster assembly accessory protein [Elusimicrobia bacterium]|nr:iron-sulfur cluster assembly accessory protein [Elusimicrobiota bacterium]
MITLTPSAVKKVQEFFQVEPSAKGKALRIAVQPGGCSGYSYAFGFDDKRDGDNEIVSDGFNVLIDPQSAGFLKDSKVDYVEDPTGAGFKIENPNVKKSCGCGQSNQF